VLLAFLASAGGPIGLSTDHPHIAVNEIVAIWALSSALSDSERRRPSGSYELSGRHGFDDDGRVR